MSTIAVPTEVDVKEDHDHYYGGTEVKADVDDNNADIVVRLENIHKTYLLGIEGVPALRGVSLSIKRGEFVVIFGLSGGGKTTLLNIMGTIDKPTKGEMYLCGTRIDSRTDDATLSQIRLTKLGFVFQTFNLLSSLTALENVEMPMILAGRLSAAERRQRAIALLERVGMGKRLDHLPSQLSGGEQQRVTIARAVANEPDILLLDEPTGDLDTLNTAIAMKLLTDLNREQKITLVMVTHDVGLKNFADRVVWMRDGKIVRVEKVHEQKRRERYAELEEEIVRLTSGHKNLAKLRPPGFNTVVRRPEDYVFHPHHKKRETELLKFDKLDLTKITLEEYEKQAFGGRKESPPPARPSNKRSSDSKHQPEIATDILIDIGDVRSNTSSSTDGGEVELDFI